MVIILTGLLAGFLDGTAAVLLFMARGNKNPALLFRYIASAVYGKAAFSEGSHMVLRGVLFHFLIAGIFVGVYFGLSVYVSWFRSSPLAGAIVYGLLIWVIMNLGVVPRSKATPRPFSFLFAVVNMLILIVAIGLPTAYIARWYFQRY
jgi:hypothetical protein